MKKNIIYESQRALYIKNGRIVKEVGPGLYRTSSLVATSFAVYSIAPQNLLITGIFNTKDKASITVELSVISKITDIRKIYMAATTAYEIVSRSVKNLMQEYIEQQTLADILDGNIEVSNDSVSAELAESGVEAEIVGNARIRLPRNLQNAIDAQEVARQKAKAEIEEARGRTAVLRHYANAAKMTEKNPELLKLLIGQKAKSVNFAFDTCPK